MVAFFYSKTCQRKIDVQNCADIKCLAAHRIESPSPTYKCNSLVWGHSQVQVGAQGPGFNT